MHEKTWVYILIRTDLPLQQQMVQAAHAALEAGMRWPQVQKDPSSLVMLQVKDREELHAAERFLGHHDIGSYTFFEPDWDYGYTAIGTQPLNNARRTCMRRFKLWGK